MCSGSLFLMVGPREVKRFVPKVAEIFIKLFCCCFLNPLRPGVHLSVQNINCCWLGTGPVEYFCCADLLQVVGIEHFYIQMHCGNTSCDLSTWLLHQRFL